MISGSVRIAPSAGDGKAFRWPRPAAAAPINSMGAIISVPYRNDPPASLKPPMVFFATNSGSGFAGLPGGGL